MPLVSVIIPAYNAQSFIGECVSSITSQAFSDWELIIINDGSKDETGSLCDEMSEKEKRIKVIHTSNHGVSHARNVGIQNAEGTYVAFVDADDYVGDNFFSPLIGAKEDLIVLQSKVFGKNGVIKSNDGIPVSGYENPEEKKIWLETYLHNQIMRVPWGKFFKRECIDRIRFNEGQPIGEDTLFVLDFIFHCKSLKVVCDVYYFWRVSEYSGRYRISVSEAISYLKKSWDAYQKLEIKNEATERDLFLEFYIRSAEDRKIHPRQWYSDTQVQKIRSVVEKSMRLRDRFSYKIKHILSLL